MDWQKPFRAWLAWVDARSRAARAATVVAGLFLLGGVAALDWLLFRTLFETDYLRWYLENGSLIGIVFGLVTLAWGDLNKLTGLVSAHPLEYLATCVGLGTLPSMAVGAGLESDARPSKRAVASELSRQLDELTALTGLTEEQKERIRGSRESAESAGEVPEPEVPPRGLGFVDVVLGALFVYAFVVTFAAWLLVVVPLQFVVNLVAGAPARRALASPARAWSRITPHEIHVEEALKSDAVPDDATESGFSAKPVTFTAAIASGLLFAASRLVG